MTEEEIKKTEGEFNSFVVNKKPGLAKRFIDEKLVINKEPYLFYLKAKLLYDIEGFESALICINDGLLEDFTNYDLLFYKAQILAFSYLNLPILESKSKLREALEIVNLCEDLFKNKYSELLTWEEVSVSSIIEYSKYSKEKNDLDNLKNNINNLLSNVFVYGEIQNIQQNIQNKNIDVENKLFKERIRLIEILGLFVAIFAFIFSTVQISIKFEIVEAITLISALALLLILFLLILHLVLNPEEKTKVSIIAIILLLVFLFTVIPLLPDLIFLLKNKLF